MNSTSGNLTYIDKWTLCIKQGYVWPILCGTAQVLCVLLGTPTLIWCLWISLNGSLTGDLKPTLVFPINLFVLELVFCVNGLLQVIGYSLSWQKTVMEVFYFFFYLAWICRPIVQSCICVERYLAVVKPVAFFKYRLLRYRVGCSIIVWVLSLISAFALTLTGNGYIEAPVLIAVYCLGVVIVSRCCFFILRVLKHPGPGEVEGGRGGEKKQGTTDPQKRRAFGVVMNNLVIMLVSSISVVVGFATISSISIVYCNTFPILLIVNIFSVIISPLLHLHREGRLPCRRGPETPQT